MPLIKSANVPTSVTPFSMANIEAHAKTILIRARKKAEGLLVAAQVEAEALKKEARAQGIAEGKRDGLVQGTAEGKKSGHDQALAEHREKFTAATATLLKLVGQLEASRGDLEAQALRSVIELSASIARRVTKRQALIEPQVLLANLAGAMKLVSHLNDIRIAVHPSQMQTLRDELPNIRAAWPQLKHVELIEDAKLSPGGCRIFTAHGAVDGDLDSQLDRVVDQLLPPPESAA
jgi:flagellar assembly protein FliH